MRVWVNEESKADGRVARGNRRRGAGGEWVELWTRRVLKTGTASASAIMTTRDWTRRERDFEINYQKDNFLPKRFSPYSNSFSCTLEDLYAPVRPNSQRGSLVSQCLSIVAHPVPAQWRINKGNFSRSWASKWRSKSVQSAYMCDGSVKNVPPSSVVELFW